MLSSEEPLFLTLTSCFIRLLSKMVLLEAVLEPLLEPLFELVLERVTIPLVCLFLPRVPSLTELLEVLFADLVEDLALVDDLPVELLVDLLVSRGL